MYSTEEPVQSVQACNSDEPLKSDSIRCSLVPGVAGRETAGDAAANVFSKVSSQEDMRLARIKSTASGFAQSGFVKKELYAGFEIPAKETAMILTKGAF